MQPISLQQAFDGLLNQLKDLSDVPTATFVQWCEFINEFAYRYLLGVDPERFIKELPFQILNNVSVYPVNSDFHDMQTWDTGFFVTDGNGQNTGIRLPLTSPGSGATSNIGVGNNYGIWSNIVTGYYINGNNFVFTPVPKKDFLLIERYCPNITVLSSMSQYFTVDGTLTGFPIISYEYLNYCVKALATQYMVWDEEPGAESYADARFVRCLDELCENIRRQPQTMGMLDFSQIY